MKENNKYSREQWKQNRSGQVTWERTTKYSTEQWKQNSNGQVTTTVYCRRENIKLYGREWRQQLEYRYIRQRKRLAELLYYCWSKTKAGTTVILVCRTKPVAMGVKTIVERKKTKSWENNNISWENRDNGWKCTNIVGRVKAEAGKTTIMVGRQRQWLG
jgi:hypothetical protein